MILVDTCVLLDVFTRDPRWEKWSARALAQWGEREQLGYSPITLAELSVHARSEADLGHRLRRLHRRDLPWKAAWLAGQAFAAYLTRRAGQGPRAPLPDFLIGAQAMVENLPVLTRDPKRMRAAFPTLRLICP